jgi:hypothetical protein
MDVAGLPSKIFLDFTSLNTVVVDSGRSFIPANTYPALSVASHY